MNQAILDLRDEVTQTVGIAASAAAIIRGIPGVVQAAIDQALADGASQEVVDILTGLKADLDAASSDLEAAVLANSPPPPNP